MFVANVQKNAASMSMSIVKDAPKNAVNVQRLAMHIIMAQLH